MVENKINRSPQPEKSKDYKVPKLPQAIQKAFNLAIEHNIFSGYTISNHGFIREYARELMKRYHWSFRKRP